MTTSETLPEAGLRDRLLGMTTATATAMLDKRGYPNQFMLGAHAIQRSLETREVLRHISVVRKSNGGLPAPLPISAERRQPVAGA
jgi:hypothetical protein